MSDTQWRLTSGPIDPGHYALKTIEPIAVIEAWGLGFNLGSAIKYIARCEEKGTRRDDLIKAANYLFREATGKWLPKEILDGPKAEVVQEITGRDEGDTSGFDALVRSFFSDIKRKRLRVRHSNNRRKAVAGGTEAPRSKRREQDDEVAAPARVRDRLRSARKRKA